MKSYLTILTCAAILFCLICGGCQTETVVEDQITPTQLPDKQAEPVKVEVEVEAEAETVEKAKVESVIEPKAEIEKAKPVPVKAIDLDEPAVTVNGVVITEGELDAKIKPQIDKMIASQGPDSKIPPQYIEQTKQRAKTQLLEMMTVGLLIDQAGEKEGVEVSDEELNGQLEMMASQRKVPVEQLKEMMKGSGLDAEDFIRKSMMLQKLIEVHGTEETNVTADEVKQYYDQNPARFSTPEQVRASHILIKPEVEQPGAQPTPEAKAAAKAKAQELFKQVQDGADFATLARENSGCPSSKDGGDLKFFPKGQMVSEFDKAAFDLKVGQVSDVVETQFGYHIIKLTDRKDATVTTFEQAKDDIANILMQNKQREFTGRYIESLKSEANIVYPEGKEPQAIPNRPAARQRPNGKKIKINTGNQATPR
ncbi:peptidylprolyl isomerase [Planctomycetota bacterium]